MSHRGQPRVVRSAGFAHSVKMNDVIDPVNTKPKPVRARDAASLILLRGEGRDLELLAGRRPLTVRFMPGVYVFPGGAVDAEDTRPWQSEIDVGALPPRLMRCAIQ